MRTYIESTDLPNSRDTHFHLGVGDVLRGTFDATEPDYEETQFAVPDANLQRADVVAFTAGDRSYDLHISRPVSATGIAGDFAIIHYKNGGDLDAGRPNGATFFVSQDQITQGRAATFPLDFGTNYFLLAGESGDYQFAITEVGETPDFSIASEEISGTDGDDAIEGTAADSTLFGLAGNDVLYGDFGNNIIDGGAGEDTVLAGQAANQSTIRFHQDGTIEVLPNNKISGTQILRDVEHLDFVSSDLDDREVRLFFGADESDFDLRLFDGIADISGTELETLVELYIAYFNRAPDATGLFFWGNALSDGMDIDQIARLFIDQDETRAVYPEDTTNLDFVTQVYTNVLGRTVDPAGLEFWQEKLDLGLVSRDVFILEVLKGVQVDLPAGTDAALQDVQIADRGYLGTKTDIGVQFGAIKGLSNVTAATEVMDLYVRDDAGSIQNALDRIDLGFEAATQSALGGRGELLLQLVGVIDDPF